MRGSEGPSHDGFDEGAVARASGPDADAEVQLEPRKEMEIERRHDEVLLMLRAGQHAYRAHVAVIFERGRQPPHQVLIFEFARGCEGDAAMRPRATERLFEGEVSDQRELAEMRLRDRA